MPYDNAQAIIASVVLSVSTTVTLTALYLLWKRRNHQPLKSRWPLWLGISLTLGHLQTGINLWALIEKSECNFLVVGSYLVNSGYAMCLIIRCWKLHFTFNINKNKLLNSNYEGWFNRHKIYAYDRLLVPLFTSCCVFLLLLGFISNAAGSPFKWQLQFGCNLPQAVVITNNVIIIGLVIVLIIFSILLRNIDDAFNISRELQFSIVITIVAWFIFNVLLYAGGPTFRDPLNGGTVSAMWAVVISQLCSVSAAVYYPIYLSFTRRWVSDEILDPPVTLNELGDMNYFLNSPFGVQPFLRYLHSEFSAELLFIWRDIEEFSKEPDLDERKIKAKSIIESYLDPRSDRTLHPTLPLSSTLYDTLLLQIDLPDLPPTIFNEVKVEVEKNMRNIFNRFLKSHAFQQYAREVTIKESLVELGLK